MNIDELRERKDGELGLRTDNDFALISDSSGILWQTETLKTGEQVKSLCSMPEAQAFNKLGMCQWFGCKKPAVTKIVRANTCPLQRAFGHKYGAV